MKRFLIVVAVVAGAVFGGLAWYLRPQSQTYFTDADTIREQAGQVSTRDVLWQPPVLLAGGIDSPQEEYEPRVSADGQTLFFVRGKAGGGADIYMARRAGREWTEPVALTSVNSSSDDLGPEPSPDGQTLYFYSDRDGGLGGYDLWMARRDGDAWSEPVNLGTSVNSEFNDYGPAVPPDGQSLYFASNRPKPGEVASTTQPENWPATLREEHHTRDYDLYTASLTERGLGPARPLDALNTAANEGSVAVSPVGDFVYFASDRPGGRGGLDLYRARRIRGAHEPAENLGPAINTSANELDPALSMGGYALHFSSDRPVAGAPADARHDYNIYYSTSREVFTQREVYRASIDWAGLWARTRNNLLWSILALLSLLFLLALLRDAKNRKLGLLTRCLLASLAVHMALMLLFHFWRVTASVAQAIRHGGRIQVALAGSGGGGDIITQVRGGLTNVSGPAPATGSLQKWTPLMALTPKVDAGVRVPVEKHEAPHEDVQLAVASIRDASAPVRGPQLPSSAVPDEHPAPLLIDVSLPAQLSPSRVAEPDVGSAARPTDATPINRATPVSLASAAPPVEEFKVAPVANYSVDQAKAESTPMATVSPREARPAASSAMTPRPAVDLSRADLPSPDGAFARSLALPHDAAPASEQAAEPSVAFASAAIGAPGHAAAPNTQVITGEPTASVQNISPAGGTSTANDSTSLANVTLGVPRDSQPASDSKSLPLVSAAGNTLPGLHGAESGPAIALTLPPAAVPGGSAGPDSGDDASGGATEGDLNWRPVLPAVAVGSRTGGGSPSSQPGDAPAASVQTVLSVAGAPAGGETSSLAAVGSNIARDSQSVQGSLAPLAAIGFAARDGKSGPGDGPALSLALPADAPSGETGGTGATKDGARDAQSGKDRPAWQPALVGLGAGPYRGEGQSHHPAGASTGISSKTAPLDVEPQAGGGGSAIGPGDSLVDTRTGPRDAPLRPGVLFGDPARAVGGRNEIPAATLAMALPPDQAEQGPSFEQRAPENRRQYIERMGGSDDTEAAVSLALAWLAAHQSPDGHWDADHFDDRCGRCGGQTDIEANVALTGLSLLCFLGADHTHAKDGPYRDHVERALHWLIRRERPNGDLRGYETMYSQGIATIALSESYGMTEDGELADPVRRAANFIVEARNRREGGWRYDPGQFGDTSVLGWQVMALKSARMAGVDVPEPAFEAARRWLDVVAKGPQRGLYAYQPNRNWTLSMTAEGLFAQQLLGRGHDDDRMKASAEQLGRKVPDWSEVNTYYWYYGTLALFQQQGPEWERWNEALKKELLAHQNRRGRPAGSWDPADQWSRTGGRVYQTALCTLMLEVYYRYLPLYSIDKSKQP